MTRLVPATRSALASGRFISAWTIGASLLLSLTVMAPAVSGPAAQVFAAGFLTWVCFAAALAVLGALERVCGRGAAPHRAARVRTTIVVVGVALIAAARPAVQDAWLRSVGVTPPEEWQLLFRVATNVAVWVVVFTAIAIVVGALRSLRDTNALLRAAVAERADLDRRTAAFDAVARDSVHRAIGDVSRALTVLAASDHAGADDVRAFAVDEVRPASHALAELAHAPVPALAPPPDPADPGTATDARDARDPADPSAARDPSDAAASVTRAMRLRVPPRWAVAVLYAACVLPYALRATSLLEIGAGVLVAIGGGALIGGASRHRGIRHPASRSGLRRRLDRVRGAARARRARVRRAARPCADRRPGLCGGGARGGGVRGSAAGAAGGAAAAVGGRRDGPACGPCRHQARP